MPRVLLVALRGSAAGSWPARSRAAPRSTPAGRSRPAPVGSRCAGGLRAASRPPCAFDGVVDRPVRGAAEQLRVVSEQPRAGRVKRGRADLRGGLLAQQLGQPQPQLRGGADAERDREDLARLCEPLREQERDPVDQRLGLAGAGPGDDQQHARAVAHRLGLLRGQPGQQAVEESGAVPAAAPRRRVRRLLPFVPPFRGVPTAGALPGTGAPRVGGRASRRAAARRCAGRRRPAGASSARARR